MVRTDKIYKTSSSGYIHPKFTTQMKTWFVKNILVRPPKQFVSPLTPNIKKIGALVCPKKVAKKGIATIRKWAIKHGARTFSHFWIPWTDQWTIKELDIHDLNENNWTVQQPDDSSFPTGGLSATHRARGYTIKNGRLPFIYKNVLLIPSVMVNFRGHHVGLRLPLGKALQALNQSAGKVLEKLGVFDPKIQKVAMAAGPEQEYSIAPLDIFKGRPDLISVGRFLLGTLSIRHQQDDANYLGFASNKKVRDFRAEVALIALQLGINIEAEHQEVAPNQHEGVPKFAHYALQAADDNFILMMIIHHAARNHGLAALFNEKVMTGNNGAGKHVNVSTGIKEVGKFFTNLDDIEKAPNSQVFLLNFLTQISAVQKRAQELRAMVAVPGNELRLGKHEAPPAIIAVNIGEAWEHIFEEIEKGSIHPDDTEAITKMLSNMKGTIDVQAPNVPPIKKDEVDRNRTSSFAYTGGKFEFRMPGASQPIYLPLAVIAAAQAEAYDEINKRLEKLLKENKNMSTKEAMNIIIQKLIQETKPIIHNGNAYAEAWIKEAQERGLPNHKTSSEALKAAFENEDSLAFFDKYGIFTPKVAKAYYIVRLKQYADLVEMESNAMHRMLNEVENATWKYLGEVFRLEGYGINLKSKKVHPEKVCPNKVAKDVVELTCKLRQYIEKLEKMRKKLKALTEEGSARRSAKHAYEIRQYMEKINELAGKLEIRLGKYWPFPTYEAYVDSFR